jgi:chemotaxis protein methyltransferase CheR
MATVEPAGPGAWSLDDEPSWTELRRIVRVRLGVDLAAYKDKCVERRLAVRLRARRCRSLAEYLGVLTADEAEVSRFLAALTINVTEFFRNPGCFERIREVCLPRLFGREEGAARRPATRPIRVWSVGCASGEEPYSLAVVFREYMEQHPAARRIRVEITGTDLDGEMIGRAQGGVYEEARLREVSQERRARWFRREGAGWSVAPEIRSMVRFEAADAFRTEPAELQDLIVCRNMLIYLTREQQETIFTAFHRTLAPGGFLVLGKAEILIPSARRLFETRCARERIHERRI